MGGQHGQLLVIAPRVSAANHRAREQKVGASPARVGSGPRDREGVVAGGWRSSSVPAMRITGFTPQQRRLPAPPETGVTRRRSLSRQEQLVLRLKRARKYFAGLM